MLELNDVDTAYGPVPMLRGLSIKVQPGELVCLLGPNGAGKTTTFMTVCGVVRALRGKVDVMGRDMASLGTENLAGAWCRAGAGRAAALPEPDRAGESAPRL